MHLTAQMQYGEKLYQKMNLLTAFGPLESIKVQNKFYLLHCFQPSMEHQLIFQSCDVIGVQGQNLFYCLLVHNMRRRQRKKELKWSLLQI